MKRTQQLNKKYYFLIVTLFALLVSCRLSDFNFLILKTLKEGQLLEIDPEFNCYVSDNGNHYYSDSFNNVHEKKIYRLSVKNAEQYTISFSQPDESFSPDIKMVLVNSMNDTLAISSTLFSSPRIFFESWNDEVVYLFVYSTDPDKIATNYNLYFESIEYKSLDFAGYHWNYTSNWQISGTDTLIYKNIDSHQFRLIGLDPIIADIRPQISFSVKSSEKNDLISFGFIYGESSFQIDWGNYNKELPNSGYLINIKGKETCRFSKLRPSGMGMYYTYFPAFDISKGVQVKAEYYEGFSENNYCVYVNGLMVLNAPFEGFDRFYLFVEDRGFDDVIFYDFELN